MKKILICLMAVLLLGLCIMAVTPDVQAEETSDPILYHCKCGRKHSTALEDGEITWKEGTSKCASGCDGVILEWTKWDANSPKNPGNYYFATNITTTRTWTTDVAFNVDMNGYDIIVTGATRAINMSAGTINICNTKTTGGSIAGYGPNADKCASINMWGGSLTLFDIDVTTYNGGNSITNGGAVYLNNCSFTTYGGSITGCTVSDSGGALFAKKAANVSLNGTVVTGGTAGRNGGNICVEDGRTGSFDLNYCTIYGGVAVGIYDEETQKTDGGNGGNLWLGTVAEGGPLAIMLTTKIYGGTGVSGGSVMTKCRLAMQGGSIGVGSDGAEAGGIASNRGGNVFINDCELVMNLDAVIAYGNSGSSNGGNVFIGGANGTGKLTMNTDSIVKNGYTALNGGNIYMESGSLYMGGDTSISGGDALNLGGNICMVAGEATMKGNSFIAGGGVSGVYGSETASGACKDGGNVYIGAKATFTLEGAGNVRNGMVTGNGSQTANFYVGGTLNIGGTTQVYGGLVNKTKRNIHVMSTGTLNVYGNAKIDGGITAAGGTIKLSDNVTVDTYRDGRADRTIYLAAAVVIDATELGENAVVKLYDGATATGGRKIATVTADQTWIKTAVSLMETNKLTGWMLTREKDADGNVVLWLRESAAVAASASTGAEGVYDFASYDEAYAAAEENGTMVLYADVDGAVIEKNLLIDLNGNDLTNVTIPEGVTLTGMDSSTDGYDCTEGYGTVSGTIEGTIAYNVKTTVAQAGSVKRYLAVNEDGVYSFHRFYMGITHASIKPASDGVGYKAVFKGSDIVKQQVTGFGYTMQLGGNSPVTVTGTEFVSGKTVSLCVNNYDVANYGEIDLNASVFISFGDVTLYTGTVSYSMKDMMQAANAAFSGFEAAQQEALTAMVEKYYSVMQNWEVGNIYTPTQDGTEVSDADEENQL